MWKVILADFLSLLDRPLGDDNNLSRTDVFVDSHTYLFTLDPRKYLVTF